MFYKITHHLVSMDQNLSLVLQTTSITRNTGPLHFQTFITRTDYYKCDCFPHKVTLWNTLPHSVVSGASLGHFFYTEIHGLYYDLPGFFLIQMTLHPSLLLTDLCKKKILIPPPSLARLMVCRDSRLSVREVVRCSYYVDRKRVSCRKTKKPYSMRMQIF